MTRLDFWKDGCIHDLRTPARLPLPGQSNRIFALGPATLLIVLSIAGLSNATVTKAQNSAAPADFSISNPTPDSLLRPLSPDRPDGTESPITVDAGRFQIEASIADYARMADDSEAWVVGEVNAKLGLTTRLDIQLIVAAYASVKETAGADRVSGGPTAVTLRAKFNLWGNELETGGTACAVMPFVRIPTGSTVSSDHVEAGLIATTLWSVRERLSVAGMVEAGALHVDDAYRAVVGHTLVAGIDLPGPLGTYLEYIGSVGLYRQTDYEATFSTGAITAIGYDTSLDVGLRLGITNNVPDYRLFGGFSVRI